MRAIQNIRKILANLKRRGHFEELVVEGRIM
jgi:hypothetical protein